jgi:SPP1 family predicted phage head-tail adaptor
MNIGKLNKRITIQSQSSTFDAAGQQVESWSTFATVWANIKHLSGIETIKSDAMASTVKASIRIRYIPGINAGMQVIYQNLTYRIEAVLAHVDEKRYIDMTVELINGSSP